MKVEVEMKVEVGMKVDMKVEVEVEMQKGEVEFRWRNGHLRGP